MTTEIKATIAGIGGGGAFLAAGEVLDMSQLGAAAIFIILVLQVVLKFLKDSREKREGVQLPDGLKRAIYDSSRRIETMEQDWGNHKNQLRDLHNWHDAEDGRGRKIWYGLSEAEVKTLLEQEMSRQLAPLTAQVAAVAVSLRRDT